MFKRLIALLLCLTLVLLTNGPSMGSFAYAQDFKISQLPVPGSMVDLSVSYDPVLIKGLQIHPENPLLFDFIIDTGHTGLQAKDRLLNQESEKIIKYFLATITIPDNDLWVNLSPYEKNRMIPGELGQTTLGRDMLAQDYMLKQLTASLIYPEKDLGQAFWERVYAKARQMYGTTQIPINTFNKVWIVGQKAKVYVHDNTAFVVGTHLKVMLEEDYVALTKHQGLHTNATHTITSNIVRELILPEIEKEVNSGKNFSNLRQIFYSMILATWYKKNLKEALLNQVYANKSKINGVDVEDKAVKDRIYEQYLKAYKKGVFNYIKDTDTSNGASVPRKYFSGGLSRLNAAQVVGLKDPDCAMFSKKSQNSDFVKVQVRIASVSGAAKRAINRAINRTLNASYEIGDRVSDNARRSLHASRLIKKEFGRDFIIDGENYSASISFIDQPELYGYTVKFKSFRQPNDSVEIFLGKNIRDVRKVLSALMRNPKMKKEVTALRGILLQDETYASDANNEKIKKIIETVYSKIIRPRRIDIDGNKPLLQQVRRHPGLNLGDAAYYANVYYQASGHSAIKSLEGKFKKEEVIKALGEFIFRDAFFKSYPPDLSDVAIEKIIFSWLSSPSKRPNPLDLISLRGKNIVVTGGYGYLGSVVVEKLLAIGANVTVYGRSYRSEGQAIGHEKYEYGDLNDKNKLEKVLKKADVVIHLAGSSTVGESIQEPEKYAQNNTDNTGALVDVARLVGCNNIIMASTVLTGNNYAISKQLGELRVEDAAKNGINYGINHFSNIAGARWIKGRWYGQKTQDARFMRLIEKLITTALNSDPHKLPVEVKHGMVYLLDVEDAANAVVASTKYRIGGGDSGNLTFTPEQGFSTAEIVAAVEQVAREKGKFLPVKWKKGLIPKNAVSPQEYRNGENGFKALHLNVKAVNPEVLDAEALKVKKAYLVKMVTTAWDWYVQESYESVSLERMKNLLKDRVETVHTNPDMVFRELLVFLAMSIERTKRYPKIEDKITSHVLRKNIGTFNIADEHLYKLLNEYMRTIKKDKDPLYVLRFEYLKVILKIWEHDHAMAVTTPGGIDLNAKNLQMELDQPADAIHMQFNKAMIAAFKKGDFSGVVPAILDIEPLPKNYFAKYFAA